MNFNSDSILRIGVSVALLTVLATVPAQAQSDEVQEIYASGLQLLQNEQPEKAVEELQKVVEADDTHAGAHYYLGMAYGQLQRFEEAERHFARAAELDPGNGQVYERACRAAWFAGNYEAAWQHCIAAAQAGRDMQGAFAELAKQMEGPEGYEESLDVPRLFVPALDISALMERDTGIFSDTDFGDAGEESGDFGTQAGTSVAAEVQSDLAEVRRRFALELVGSPAFGVVQERDAARWVLLVEVDEVAGGRQLDGYLKLVDPESGEAAWERPLRLSNISSMGDLRNDIGRYVGYMERWLREGPESQ